MADDNDAGPNPTMRNDPARPCRITVTFNPSDRTILLDAEGANPAFAYAILLMAAEEARNAASVARLAAASRTPVGVTPRDLANFKVRH